MHAGAPTKSITIKNSLKESYPLTKIYTLKKTEFNPSLRKYLLEPITKSWLKQSFSPFQLYADICSFFVDRNKIIYKVNSLKICLKHL